MRKCKLFISIVILIICYFIVSSPVYSQSPSNFDCSNGFQALFPSLTQSIQYKEVRFTSPLDEVAHIVKVDLNDENIDLTTTPRYLLGNTTSVFMSGVGAALAINGSGFLAPDDPIGFNAGQGDIYSQENTGLMKAFISEDNDFRFSYTRPRPVWDALDGMNALIRNGNMNDNLRTCLRSGCGGECDQSYCGIRSRTALGYNEGDNELLIIVVEENSNSRGATLYDMSQMMNECGADNANNQDGGGSSTLAAITPNAAGNRALINRISTQRVVSNHLGICIGRCNIPGPITPLPNIDLPQGEARPRYTGPVYPFPCDRVAPNEAAYGDDEFHSLRPYQASPCNRNKEELALFCGNDLFVGDTVSVVKHLAPDSENYTYEGDDLAGNPPFPPNTAHDCFYCSSTNPGVCETNPDPNCVRYEGQCNPVTNNPCGQCTNSANGVTETCTFTITDSKRVVVDLQGAEFPIMGYTEPSAGNSDDSDPKVINSVNTEEETMDHATKVSEYVSWYLNGVNGRAEYPYLNPKLDCVGATTQKAGSCMEARYDQNSGNLECYGTWGIPFIDPFRQVTLMPDGKGVCTGTNTQCCVSRHLPTLVERTPSSDYIINQSGPVKKLLPFSIQNAERIQEIDDGTDSDRNNAGIRHSQVVGCDAGYSSDNTFLLSVLNFFGLEIRIGGIPVECYGGKFFGFINIPSWLITKNRLTGFNSHKPPIEEDPQYLGENFTEWIIDYKEWRGNVCVSLPIQINALGYQLVNHIFYLCFDNPFSPNVWGNLFSYIPFSSTEDRLGDVKIKSARLTTRSYSRNFRILYTRITNVKNADLFFPHMEEDVGLAELLQKTFAYGGADLNDLRNAGFTPYSPYCEYAQVRTNPGDDLFAGELSANIEYTVQVTCTYYNWRGPLNPITPVGNLCNNLISGGECVPGNYYCDSYHETFDCAGGQLCCSGTTQANPNSGTCGGGFGICVPENYEGGCTWINTNDCSGNFRCALLTSMAGCGPHGSHPTTQSCTNELLVNVSLETRTPLADKAWAKLVAGSAGIFRRMFPFIGEGGAVEGILDMPTSTDVEYSSPDAEIVYAGNPSSQTSGAEAKLYFPHIGGIKEYFLTGIQTMLRPKGYGTQIVSGGPEGEPREPVSDDNTDALGVCDAWTWNPQVSGNWCSPETLNRYCPAWSLTANDPCSPSHTIAQTASYICNRESGGATGAINDGCLCGRSVDFSVGLFQINLLPGRCPGAFSSWSWAPSCVIADPAILQDCIDYYTEGTEGVIRSIEKACRLWTDHSWYPWHTDRPATYSINYADVPGGSSCTGTISTTRGCWVCNYRTGLCEQGPVNCDNALNECVRGAVGDTHCAQ